MSFRDDIAGAAGRPTYSTLELARELVPDLSAAEYGVARVIHSEYGSGSPVELCCVADAVLNGALASGRQVVDFVTAGTSMWGSQGTLGQGARRRPVSSRLDPNPKHIVAALATMRGAFFGLLEAPARGIARGARRFLDPRVQLEQSRLHPETHRPPLVVLEAWTFAYRYVKGQRDAVDRSRKGLGQEEWVGPIDGVDAWELMLMRPATHQQQALYEAARRVIESEGTDQSGPAIPPNLAPLVELLVVLAASAGLALASSGRVFV